MSLPTVRWHVDAAVKCLVRFVDSEQTNTWHRHSERAAWRTRLFEQAQQDVGGGAALVGLIHHDDAVGGQQRVLRQLPQQHPVRQELDLRHALRTCTETGFALLECVLHFRHPLRARAETGFRCPLLDGMLYAEPLNRLPGRGQGFVTACCRTPTLGRPVMSALAVEHSVPHAALGLLSHQLPTNKCRG